jgi:hypothetical protein
MSKAIRHPKAKLKPFAPGPSLSCPPPRHNRPQHHPFPSLCPRPAGMEVVRYSFERHKDFFTLEIRRLIEDEYDVTLAFPEDGKVTIFGRDTQKVRQTPLGRVSQGRG